MGEDFIGDDRGVVVDVDLLDGQGGYFSKEDSSEGIGYACVYAGEGECRFERLVLVELDSKSLCTLDQGHASRPNVCAPS